MGKSLKILIAVTAILIFISIYLIFGYAEIEKTMLEVQKIFYFHVSSALTVFVAFGVNFVFSNKVSCKDVIATMIYWLPQPLK